MSTTQKSKGLNTFQMITSMQHTVVYVFVSNTTGKAPTDMSKKTSPSVSLG